MMKMKLLDKETDYYILKETGWDLGFGDIYDKEGTTIGKMDRYVISLRAVSYTHLRAHET